jgi:hypothetical protein
MVTIDIIEKMKSIIIAMKRRVGKINSLQRAPVAEKE